MKNILLKKACFSNVCSFSRIFNTPSYLSSFQTQISYLNSQPPHYLSSEKYHKPFLYIYLNLKEKNERALDTNRLSTELKQQNNNSKPNNAENSQSKGFLFKQIENVDVKETSQVKSKGFLLKKEGIVSVNDTPVFLDEKEEKDKKGGKKEQEEEEEEEEEERESSYLKKDDITDMDNKKILDAFRSLLKLCVSDLNNINSEVRGLISSISLFETAWKDKEIRENADLITRILLKQSSTNGNPFLVMSLVSSYITKAHLIKEVEEDEDLLLLILNNLFLKGHLYPLDFLVSILIKIETYKLTQIPKERILVLINEIILSKTESNQHLVISIFRLNNLPRLSPELKNILNLLIAKDSSVHSESPLISLPSSLLSILFRSHLLGKNQLFTQKEEKQVKNNLKNNSAMIGFRRMVLLYGTLVKKGAHPDLEELIKGEIIKTIRDSHLGNTKFNQKSLKSLLDIALSEYDRRKRVDNIILTEVNRIIAEEKHFDWNLAVSLIQINNRICEILVGEKRDKFLEVYHQICEKIFTFYQMKIKNLTEKSGFPFFYAAKLTGYNLKWAEEFEKKALESNDPFVAINYHRASLFLLLPTKSVFEQQIIYCFPSFPSYEILSYLLDHVVQNRKLIKNWELYDLIRKKVFDNRDQLGWVKLTSLLSRGCEIFTFYKNHEMKKLANECCEWLKKEGYAFPQTLRHLVRFFRMQGQLQFFKNLENFIIENPEIIPLQLGWYIFSNIASFRIHDPKLTEIFRTKVERHLNNMDCLTSMHILNSFLLINYSDRHFLKYLIDHIEGLLNNESKLNQLAKIISLAKLCILTIDLEYCEDEEAKKFWGGLNALRTLTKKTEEALKSNVFSSIFHENVGYHLKKMGLRFKQEFDVGPFALDFLIEFDNKKENIKKNSDQKAQVFLEINGFQHYVINNELDANTDRKVRLLKKMGFDIISISQKEWVDSEEKKREKNFLREKLKNYIDFEECSQKIDQI